MSNNVIYGCVRATFTSADIELNLQFSTARDKQYTKT